MRADQLVELHIPAMAERLCLVRALVKRAAETVGCNEDLTEKLVIAINEACMNVIQHAYKGDGAGEIVLEILSNNSQIIFRLVDYANPIDLDRVKSRDLDDIKPGGLGVHFINEIMDDVEMGHLEKSTGNYLVMKKKIA